MGGVFCNCFEYPDVRFVLNTITLRRYDRSLNHYTNPIPISKLDNNLLNIIDITYPISRTGIIPAHVVTRPYAATETAGPGGEARCGDEPRTGPPSWPSRRGEQDRRRVRLGACAR
jgi:hypothetical protein